MPTMTYRAGDVVYWRYPGATDLSSGRVLSCYRKLCTVDGKHVIKNFYDILILVRR